MTSVEGEDIIGGGMEFPMLTLMGCYEGRVALTSTCDGPRVGPYVDTHDCRNERKAARLDGRRTHQLPGEPDKPDYWPDIENQDSPSSRVPHGRPHAEMEQTMMTHTTTTSLVSGTAPRPTRNRLFL